MTELDRRTVLRGAGAAGAAARSGPAARGVRLQLGRRHDEHRRRGVRDHGDRGHGRRTRQRRGHQGQGRRHPARRGTSRRSARSARTRAAPWRSVADDVITCPCHGSTFSAADGAHISGPATRGLTALDATVDGHQRRRRLTQVAGAVPVVGPRHRLPAWPTRRRTARPRARSRTRPGVYRFRDAHGRVIYVGKAKSLRSRLSSYFPDLAGLHPRTQTMVTTAAAVDWTVVAHRGRGAAAGVLLDQGVRPAVQRPVPRRQELPLASR